MPVHEYTIEEAATHLGVSTVTVRRRLKAGTLNGRQEPTAQGHRWIVILETPDELEQGKPLGDQANSQSSHTTTQPDDHRLVNELRDRIGYLERQFDDVRHAHDRDRDDWSEERAARVREIERLHELLAREQQTVQVLTRRLDALPEPKPAEPFTSSVEIRATEPSVRMVHLYGPEMVAALLTIGATIILAGWSNIWGVLQDINWQNVGETGRLVLALGLFILGVLLQWKIQVATIKEIINVVREGKREGEKNVISQLFGIHPRSQKRLNMSFRAAIARMLGALIVLLLSIWILETLPQ